MLVSYNEYNNSYSRNTNILTEGTRIGKDFNTLNPVLDPYKVYLNGELDSTGILKYAEKGVWSDGRSSWNVLQLQSEYNNDGYPDTMVVLFVDETYTTFVEAWDPGCVGFVCGYSGGGPAIA